MQPGKATATHRAPVPGHNSVTLLSRQEHWGVSTFLDMLLDSCLLDTVVPGTGRDLQYQVPSPGLQLAVTLWLGLPTYEMIT